MLKNKLKNLALAVLLALSGMGQAYAAQEFLPVSDVQDMLRLLFTEDKLIPSMWKFWAYSSIKGLRAEI